jgi:hypothetical protein
VKYSRILLYLTSYRNREKAFTVEKNGNSSYRKTGP